MIKYSLIYLILISISAVSSFHSNKTKSVEYERQLYNTNQFTGLPLSYYIEKPDTIILRQNNTNNTLIFKYGNENSQSDVYIDLDFPQLPFQILQKPVCYLISSKFKYNITSKNIVYFTPSLISSISNSLHFVTSFNCDIMVYISDSYPLINIFDWCKNNTPQLCRYTWFTEKVVNSEYYPVYSFPTRLLDDIQRTKLIIMYIKSVKKMMEDLKIPISLENFKKFIKSQRNVYKYSKSLYVTFNNNNIDIDIEYPLYHNGIEVGKCNINSCEITFHTYSRKSIKLENDKKVPTPPIEDCLCKDLRYCLLNDNNEYQCASSFHNFTIKSRYNGFDDEFVITWVIVEYLLIGICIIFMVLSFLLRKHRFMVFQNWILDCCIMIGTIIFCATSLIYILYVFQKNYTELHKYVPLQLYFLAFEMTFGAEALILEKVCKRITKRQISSIVPDGTVVVGGVSYRRGSCMSKNQPNNLSLAPTPSTIGGGGGGGGGGGEGIDRSKLKCVNNNNQTDYCERNKKIIDNNNYDPTLIPITQPPTPPSSHQPLTDVPNTIKITVSPTQTRPRDLKSFTATKSAGIIGENGNNNNNNNNNSQNQTSNSGGSKNSNSKIDQNKSNLPYTVSSSPPGKLFLPSDISLPKGDATNRFDKRTSVDDSTPITPCVDSACNTPNRIVLDNLEKRMGRKRTVNLSISKSEPPPNKQLQLTRNEWITYFTTIFVYILIVVFTILFCPYEIKVWKIRILYDSTEDVLNGIDPVFTSLDGLYVNLYELTSYLCFILWIFQVAYFVRELLIIFTDGEKLNVYESVLVTSIYLSLICFGLLLASTMLINVDSRTSGYVLLGLSLVYTILSLYATGYPLLDGYINPKKQEKAVDVPGCDIRCVECGYLLDYLLVPNRNKDRFKMGCPDAQNNTNTNTARTGIKNTLTNLMKSARKDSTNVKTERSSYKRSLVQPQGSRANVSTSGTRHNSVSTTPTKGRSSVERESVCSDDKIGVGGTRKSISDEVQAIRLNNNNNNNNNNIVNIPPLHSIPENGIIMNNYDPKAIPSKKLLKVPSNLNVRNSTTPANMSGIESIRIATNEDIKRRSSVGETEPPSTRNNVLYNAISTSANMAGNDFGIESKSTVPVLMKGQVENKKLDGIRLDGSLRVDNYSASSSPVITKTDSKRMKLEPLDLDKVKKSNKK